MKMNPELMSRVLLG